MIQKGTDHLEPLVYWVEEVAGERPLGRCKNGFDIIQARYEDKIWSRAFYGREYLVMIIQLFVLSRNPKIKLAIPKGNKPLNLSEGISRWKS